MRLKMRLSSFTILNQTTNHREQNAFRSKAYVEKKRGGQRDLFLYNKLYTYLVVRISKKRPYISAIYGVYGYVAYCR